MSWFCPNRYRQVPPGEPPGTARCTARWTARWATQGEARFNGWAQTGFDHAGLAFLLRGNVVDLAVAVVIGAAFTAIVTAFVEGIVNPLVGQIIGQPDLSSVVLTISDSDFLIGAVLNAVINFVLVGIVLFFMVKAFNRMMDARRNEETEEVTVEETPEDSVLLREIRDAIRTNA